MKTLIQLFALAAYIGTTTAHPPSITQMPRAEPTTTADLTSTAIEQDPWQCITKNITQYVDVPKPTGNLLSALQSYGDKLIATCTPTETVITALPSCPFPAKSLWCGFTTAAPSAVLSAYSSYGSSASSWWAAKSSAAASVSKECPVTWERVFAETPGGEAYLNNTLVFAACYADAHGGGSLPPKSTITTRSGATGVSASSPTSAATTGTNRLGASPTSTTKPNGVLGRMQDVDMWMVASTGLAAAAVNSGW